MFTATVIGDIIFFVAGFIGCAVLAHYKPDWFAAVEKVVDKNT